MKGRTGLGLAPWLVLLLLLPDSGLSQPRGAGDRVLAADGLGPVRIGMTVDQAERALGARLRPRSVQEPSGCWITQRADGQDPGVAYMVVYDQIRRIDLHAHNKHVPGVRSATGVGIGSTEQSAYRAYGARLSVAPHKYTAADGGHYLTVDTPDGRSGLVFETFGGRITQVRAGLRPELDYVEGCS